MMTLLQLIRKTNLKVERYTQVRWVSFTLPVLATGVLLFLGAFHQPYFPAAWTDEGFVIQGGMNLVRFGQYAMRSSEGFRVLDQPLVANGPGIVLPVAAAFWVFGVGLMQARLVSIAFFVLAVWAFYTLASKLFSPKAALISTVILLAFPQDGFIWFGRMVIGNVPALAYLWLGYLAWLKSEEDGRPVLSILAGILIGLALVTKAQSILFISALVAAALTDLFYYRTGSIKKYLIVIFLPLVVLAAWYVAQIILVGQENISQHFSAVASSSRVTIMVFSLERLPRNLWYMLSSGAFVMIGAPLLYAAWLCRVKSWNSARLLPMVAFVVLWTAWYVFASIGWHRYLFEAIAFSALLSGKLIADTVETWKLRRSSGLTTRAANLQWVSLLLVGVMVFLGAAGIVSQGKRLFARPDRSLQQFAAYLQTHVPDKAVIESWEWPLDALAAKNYHHPANTWVDEMTLVLTFGNPLERSYDFAPYRPDFLIDGPFSKDTQLYKLALEQGCCTLIYSQPPYDLYQVSQISLGN